jgi:hypothetical protein
MAQQLESDLATAAALNQLTSAKLKSIWKDALDSPAGVSQGEFRTVSGALMNPSYDFSPDAKAYLQDLVEQNKKGISPYRIIDGVKYDRAALEKADELVQGDGKLSAADAKTLWNHVKDETYVTTLEKNTLSRIMADYTLTAGATEFLRQELANWVPRSRDSSHLRQQDLTSFPFSGYTPNFLSAQNHLQLQNLQNQHHLLQQHQLHPQHLQPHVQAQQHVQQQIQNVISSLPMAASILEPSGLPDLPGRSSKVVAPTAVSALHANQHNYLGLHHQQRNAAPSYSSFQMPVTLSLLQAHDPTHGLKRRHMDMNPLSVPMPAPYNITQPVPEVTKRYSTTKKYKKQRSKMAQTAGELNPSRGDYASFADLATEAASLLRAEAKELLDMEESETTTSEPTFAEQAAEAANLLRAEAKERQQPDEDTSTEKGRTSTSDD